MNRQTIKISLILLSMTAVGMFPPPADTRNLAGRQAATAPPVSSEDKPSSTEQEKSPITVNQDPALPPEPLPAELWELLQQQARQNQAPQVIFTPLRPIHRILLLAAAALIVLGSVVVCRRLSSQDGVFVREINIFLLFGFLSGIAAMFVACACVGNLYLHLAAAACTVLSGFSIAALLMPQFTLTRRWVAGPPRENPPQGDN
ncbi:MAG: hypothetical protein AMJ79_04485 [Phycisphaerae bacterium SM23_30]|nr:MAG: hypothetical protein AMJ79_04485 [Phycisphaerae bacterium SM23_30]